MARMGAKDWFICYADGDVPSVLGEPLAFEEPFWAGDFPAIEDDDEEEEEEYPFPFHPLELSEAALHRLFGFVIEGYAGMSYDDAVDPFDVTLAGFRLSSPRKRGLFRRR